MNLEKNKLCNGRSKLGHSLVLASSPATTEARIDQQPDLHGICRAAGAKLSEKFHWR
jgi:hypothetical protein